VTIVRDEAGGWHGIGGYCSHGPVPLGEGDVIGRAVECWGHGSRFDLATGAPRNLPATLPVPVYRVRLENGAVLIDTSPTGEGE
jgi:3-phenylpropionate/trans-cinnamate dioxygenase ferredoxin subunit